MYIIEYNIGDGYYGLLFVLFLIKRGNYNHLDTLFQWRNYKFILGAVAWVANNLAKWKFGAPDLSGPP